MFVRESWIESRLDMPEYIFEEGDDYVTLPPDFFDSLWQPDLYFLNAKVSGKFHGKYSINYMVIKLYLVISF